MNFNKFVVTIEGLKSLGNTIPIVNGGVTHLPEFEYTNHNNCPVLLYGEITKDTEEYLGNTVLFVSRNYFVNPNETIKVRLELFKAYNASAVVTPKTSFQVVMCELIFDDGGCESGDCERSEPQVVENNISRRSVMSSDADLGVVICPKELDYLISTVDDTPKISGSLKNEFKEYIAENFVDKRTKEYKNWAAEGYPNIPEKFKNLV